MILSVIIGYVFQWARPIPADVPVRQLVWAAGILVLAFGRHSITARSPLGTVSLAALALWVVATAVVGGVLSRSASAVDMDLAGLLAFGYIEAMGGFVLALVAAIRIARIEVVPRPWRWAPGWVLGAVSAVWLLEQIIGVSGGANVLDLTAGLSALDEIARVGGTVLLGMIAIALGAAVLRRRPE